MSAAVNEKSKLAEITGVREDAIEALHLPPAKISESFNQVSHGWHWKNLLGFPSRLMIYVALISAFQGDLGILPAVGLIAAGLAGDIVADAKDKRGNVRKDLNTAVADRLVAVNPEAARKQSMVAVDLAATVKTSEPALNAAQMGEEKMSTLFNKISVGNKWATRGLCAALGLFAATLLVPAENAGISNALVLAALGAMGGAVVSQIGANKAKAAVWNEMYDKLVTLDKTQPQP